MALPLIAAGVALIGTGLYLRGARQRDNDALDALFPAPSSPPAPAAPQTRQELTEPGAWTPEMMLHRTAAAWRDWTGTAIPGGDGLPSLDPGNAALWLAAGLAGAALVVFMVKR
jgi:hypothetical protein